MLSKQNDADEEAHILGYLVATPYVLRREHEAKRDGPDIQELEESRCEEVQVPGVGPQTPHDGSHEPGADYQDLNLEAWGVL